MKAISLALLCLLSLALIGERALLWWLSESREQVEGLLGQQLNGQVRIDRLQARLSFFDPIVEVDNLVVVQGDVEPLRVGRLAVQVDLLRSLAALGLRLQALEIGSTNAVLVADEYGVRLWGTAPGPADTTPLRTLLTAGAMAVDMARIELRRPDGAPVCTVSMSGSMEGGDERRRGVLTARHGGSDLQLHFDLSGAPLEWTGWRGAARASWDYGLDATRCGQLIFPQVSVGELRLAPGGLEIRFAGAETRVRGTLDVNAEFGGVRVETGTMAFSGAGADGGAGVFAQARLDNVRVDGERVFGGRDARVRASIRDEDVRLVIPGIAFEQFAAMVLSAEGLGSQQRRWIGALQPTGVTEDIRLHIGSRGPVAMVRFRDLHVQAYKDSPGVHGAAGTLYVTTAAARAVLDETPARIEFPNLFGQQAPDYARIAGVMEVHFGGGRLAILGRNLEAQSSLVNARGELAIWRPDDNPYGETLFLRMELLSARPEAVHYYVPNGVDAGVRAWMSDSIISDRGQVHDGRLVYFGHMHPIEGQRRRHGAVGAEVAGVDLKFHPDWPSAYIEAATVVVDETGVTTEADSVGIAGGRFVDGRGRLPNGSDILRLAAVGETDARAGIDFLLASPARDYVSFLQGSRARCAEIEACIEDELWQVDGRVGLQISGRIPVGSVPAEPIMDVTAVANGLTVRNPSMEVDVYELSGPMHWSYPADFRAETLDAQFLGQAVEVQARTDDDVHIRFIGHAEMPVVRDWTELSLLEATRGTVEYEAEISIPLDDRNTRIRLESDFAGVAVDLPEPAGKEAATPRPSVLDWEFDGDVRSVINFAWGERIVGVTEFRDGLLRRAGVMFAGDRAELPDEDVIEVRGSLHRASYEEWLEAATVAAAPEEQAQAIPKLVLTDVQVDDLDVYGQPFPNMRISAREHAEFWSVDFDNPEVAGTMDVPWVGASTVSLDRLHLPGGESNATSTESPLAEISFETIPEADVELAALYVDGAPLGAWEFELRTNNTDEVRLEQVRGSLRGIQVGSEDAPASLVWTRGPQGDRTHFNGPIEMADVAEAQLAFGYDPSVVAEDLVADIDLSWPATPDGYEVGAMTGGIDLSTGSGRFREIAAGSNALRVLGIFNFAALSRRARLDFSDVFGKGLPFDVIDARAELDGGLLRFVEPALVEGTGGKLRISGQVHLETFALDNEMIVTLPVSQGLPWYAAYAALANPIAGAGVLVAERLLRDQIEQVSSARYRVTGTLDDPVLEFDGVFDIGENRENAAPPASQPAEPQPTDRLAQEPTEEMST